MPNIRTATSRGPCDCPPDGYQLGSDVVAVDIADGNPAEYGFFTANVDDFGFDRDVGTESGELRDLLGLPDPGVDTAGNVTLLFRYGSGIKVDPADHNYHLWKPLRYDCGCQFYGCQEDSTEVTAEGATTIPCFIDRFYDDEGELDFSTDKLSMLPMMILPETIGVGFGARQDASIQNMLSVDASASSTHPTFVGIPTSGNFTNYVDPYGVIHSARWVISGEILDITFITRDPRVPGVPDQGRVTKSGRQTRIFRTGMVTMTRQVLRLVTGGYVIIGQSSVQQQAEFQASFGCGDTTDNPFLHFYNNNILDQVELEGGTVAIQDPQDSTIDYIWWPTAVYGTVGTFTLNEGGQFGPVTELPPPTE